MSVLSPNIGRIVYKTLIQGANKLDLELSRCQSLRSRELDSLKTSLSSYLPRDLRGLLDSPRIIKLTSPKSPSSLSNKRKLQHQQQQENLISNYVRICSRRIHEASEAPGLMGLDSRIGFACIKHLNNRIDTLRNLVYDKSSQAEKFGIHIGVQSEFQGSDRNRYFFRYHVRILNSSHDTIKLLSRAWTIRDLDGRVTSVEGPGVVGAFPTLLPNQSYEYTSNVPLQTPLGTQSGHYMFVTLQEEEEEQQQQLQLQNDSNNSNSRTIQSKMLQVPIAPFSHRTPSIDDENHSTDSLSVNSSNSVSPSSSSAKPGRRKKRNTDDSRRRF